LPGLARELLQGDRKGPNPTSSTATALTMTRGDRYLPLSL